MFRDLNIFINDYVEFCYGGMYFLLALASAFLYKNDYSRIIYDEKHEMPKLPWDIFAYAVMLYGLPNWIAIFASPFRDMHWILPLTYVVIVVSCFTLFRFASKSSVILEIKNFFDSKYLVVMLALAFIGSFIDGRIGVSVVHLLVVFPPVIQCFLVFYKLNRIYKLKYVYLYGVFFICYLICRFVDYYQKTSVLDSFEQIVGILIPSFSGYHFASIIFFVIAALCFIKFAKDQLREKNFFTHSIYFPVCIAIFLVFAMVFVNWRVNYTNDIFKTSLMRIASGIVRSINIEKQDSYLNGVGDKSANTKFTELIKAYAMFEPMSIKPNGIFTLRRVGSRYLVNNDGNLLLNNNLVSEYNAEYLENIDSLNYAVESKTPIVVGPYHNRFGDFITAYVPFDDDSGKNTQVLGTDIEAENWYSQIGRIATSSLLYIMFLMGFPIFAYIVNVSVKYSDSKFKWFFDEWYALALGVSIYMIIAISSIAYIATEYNLVFNRQSFYSTADAKGQGINEAISSEAAQIKWILQNVSGNKIWFNNYEEFNNFAKEMSNYFDIHNLRLITAVPGRELRNFENIARQVNNYNDYYVCSYLGSSVKKKAETQNLYRVYWPALFTYPDDKTSLGLNYSSLSHLRIAIDAVLKTGQIHAVPASRRRFQGQLMILGPSQYDDNGNINSMFVAFLNLQDIIDRINPSAYNENSNYDYEIFYGVGSNEKPMASFPKNPDKAKIESWRSASLGYIYPIFAFGKTIAVRIYPKSNYSFSDFWTTNTFIATALAGIVFALVFSLFFVYQQINQRRLEAVFDVKISEAEKRAGLVREITEKLPVVSYRLKKRDREESFDVVFINSEIENWTGLAASDFISGKYSIKDVISDSDFNVLNKLVLESIVEHKPLEVEVAFKNMVNNKIIWSYGRAVPAFDSFGGLKWIDGFFIDISEEKAAENEQKNVIEEIEKINDILKEENIKIQNLTLQAESSSAAKEAFIDNICKEVKAPVVSIVELSKKLIETELPTEQLDYANIINNNSKGMMNIFDEILATREAGAQTADTPSDVKE